MIAYVEELVVDADYRNKGIGREIIRRLQVFALERRCKRFELDSGFQRPDAHRFYEQMGLQKRAFLFSKILAG